MKRIITLFALFTPAISIADAAQPLPEPSALGLVIAGVIGVGIIRKMTKKN